MINQSKKHFFRSISITVLLLGMIIFGAAQQASATAFDLGVVLGNPLTISENTLTGRLSITGDGLAKGDFLDFKALLSDSVSEKVGTTTYNLGGYFTLIDGPLGTLTGTFTSAKLVSTNTALGNIYELLGLSTSNAYYNGTISNDKGLGKLFGLSDGQTTFYGGTLTFTQTIIEPGNIPFLTSGSLTSGTATSTVPVPPSLLLLGTGLAGFAVLRRKISKK